jgi:hypothetical protein
MPIHAPRWIADQIGFAFRMGGGTVSCMENGAANRIRTCDPVITNDVLYQLSYCGGPCGFAFANGAENART